MDTYCLVARMMIHRLRLVDVHLIGHSVGGEQALRTTLQTKGMSPIKTLTLINAWGPSVFPRKTSWDFTEDVTTWPIVGKEVVRFFGGKLGGTQEMFRRVFHRLKERPHLQDLQNEISRPLVNGTAFGLFINRQCADAIVGMQKEQKRINEAVEEYSLDTRKTYGYLPLIPVLVIGTRHDRIFPYTYARGLFRAIQRHNPKTFFRKIKTSGHMPAMETPQRLALQIRNFLRKSETE
jgi:pimeloyl-ACP methyl ester carboxylesterase